MRYEADTYDTTACFGEREHQARVTSASVKTSARLALRHARAMAAVIRAAKAEHRLLLALTAIDRALSPEYASATAKLELGRQRTINATARLVAVEKEVKRGK